MRKRREDLIDELETWRVLLRGGSETVIAQLLDTALEMERPPIDLLLKARAAIYEMPLDVLKSYLRGWTPMAEQPIRSELLPRLAELASIHRVLSITSTPG